jgi:hypothetical protein
MPNWTVSVAAIFPIFDWFSLRDRTRIEIHNERAQRAR